MPTVAITAGVHPSSRFQGWSQTLDCNGDSKHSICAKQPQAAACHGTASKKPHCRGECCRQEQWVAPHACCAQCCNSNWKHSKKTKKPATPVRSTTTSNGCSKACCRGPPLCGPTRSRQACGQAGVWQDSDCSVKGNFIYPENNVSTCHTVSNVQSCAPQRSIMILVTALCIHACMLFCRQRIDTAKGSLHCTTAKTGLLRKDRLCMSAWLSKLSR